MVLLFFLLLAASPTFEESFRAGLLALQRNDLSAAASHLETASKLAPNNGRVWVALAQTYWKSKETEKADSAASRAASMGGNDSLVWSSLAIYHEGSGQTLKAADAQARYSTLAPKNSAAREKAVSLYFDAVNPLLQNRAFSDAIGILTKAKERLPDSAQIELALGVAYYGLRRFDEAADAFLKTIDIAPEVEQPYVFLGRFLSQIPGKLPEVTRQFVKFQAAHPESAMVYRLHASALNAQSSEPEKSRTLLEKALSLDANDPVSHFELGIVFDRTRRYEEAAREYERAIQLDPADAAAHYRLSRIYDRLGKADAARVERELHAKLVEAQREAAR